MLTNHPVMKTTERFELPHVDAALASVRAKIESDFYLLLERQPRAFRLALNEAEALAFQTEFPHLVFPVLAREKVNGIAKWFARQRTIRRSEPILALAA